MRQILIRRSQIWQDMHGLGYIELTKPIRHGWFKAVVVTQKIERYKNKEALLEVYDEIEKHFWGRTKEEAHKQWLAQTSKYLIYKGLPTLSKKQFNKLSFKAQCLCTPYYYRDACKKQRLRFYIRMPKGTYRIAYKRAYVTHTKRIDPLLEREVDVLGQQLLKSGYYEAHQKLDNWKCYSNLARVKKEKLKTEKTLRNLKKYAIDDILNENIL